MDKKERCDRNRNGWKLTDHSYVGNYYCNDILSLLNDEWKGDRVIHIGDYATSNDGTITSKLITELNKEFNLSSSLFSLGKSFNDVEPNNLNKKIRYVYNLDKKEYIDLYHQPIVNVLQNRVDVIFEKFNSFSLLTACGNGLGKGDFRGCNEEEVGKWAGDHFVASEKKLEKYKDFKEYNNVFYEKLKYGVFLDDAYEFTTYEGYNKQEIKKGLNCLDRTIGTLKKYDLMPAYLNLFTFNLTDNEKKELYSRENQDIKYKRVIKNKYDKDDLCL